MAQTAWRLPKLPFVSVFLQLAQFCFMSNFLFIFQRLNQFFPVLAVGVCMCLATIACQLPENLQPQAVATATPLGVEEVRQLIEDGYRHYKAGNFKIAEASFTLALDRDPQNADAHYGKGASLLALGDFAEAKQALDKAIEYNYQPLTFAYQTRGAIWLELKEPQQALSDFQEGVRLSPQDAAAYYNRGRAYNALKDYLKAVADFNRAIELDITQSAFYTERANAYVGLGDLELAMADFGRAIQIAPNDGLAYLSRAQAYLHQKEFANAALDLGKVTELEPQNANAYYLLAVALNGTSNKFQEALQAAAQAQVLGYQPESNLAAVRGIAYQQLGQTDSAIAELTQAIQASPTAEVYFHLASALVDKKEFAQAMPYFDQAVQMDAQNAAYVMARGINRHRQNDIEGAIADYTQALNLDPQLATGYYNRGLAYRTVDGALALQDLNKAIELKPDYDVAYFSRGNVQHTLGNYTAAVSDFEKALSLGFARPSLAWFGKGLALQALANYAEAKTALDEAIRLDPSNVLAYYQRSEVFTQLGETAAAEADLQVYAQNAPQTLETYLNLTAAYRKAGLFEQALAALSSAIALNPTDLTLLIQRGDLYMSQQNYTAALADFDAAINTNPTFALAYGSRGVLHWQEKNYEQALADLGKAIEYEYSPLSWAYTSRASVYSEQLLWNEAIADYTEALEIDANYTRALLGRGLAYQAIDNRDPALADLRRVLELETDPALRQQAEQHIAEIEGLSR